MTSVTACVVNAFPRAVVSSCSFLALALEACSSPTSSLFSVAAARRRRLPLSRSVSIAVAPSAGAHRVAYGAEPRRGRPVTLACRRARSDSPRTQVSQDAARFADRGGPVSPNPVRSSPSGSSPSCGLPGRALENPLPSVRGRGDRSSDRAPGDAHDGGFVPPSSCCLNRASGISCEIVSSNTPPGATRPVIPVIFPYT